MRIKIKLTFNLWELEEDCNLALPLQVRFIPKGKV
jgi:hypothetical protein